MEVTDRGNKARPVPATDELMMELARCRGASSATRCPPFDFPLSLVRLMRASLPAAFGFPLLPP